MAAAPASPLPAGTEQARAAAAQLGAAVSRMPGSGTIELRLDPPELGRVEIALDIGEQTVRAVVSADRAATMDLLRRHADLLIQHFAEAGFGDADLSFEQRTGGQQDGANVTAGTGPADEAGDLHAHGAPGLAGRPRHDRPLTAADGVDLRL